MKFKIYILINLLTTCCLAALQGPDIILNLNELYTKLEPLRTHAGEIGNNGATLGYATVDRLKFATDSTSYVDRLSRFNAGLVDNAASSVADDVSSRFGSTKISARYDFLFNTNKDILADLIKGKPDDTLLDNALKLQFSSLADALQNQREGFVLIGQRLEETVTEQAAKDLIRADYEVIDPLYVEAIKAYTFSLGDVLGMD